MAISLVELLRHAARVHADRPAVTLCGAGTLTYRDLDAASARVADALPAGRGDRVGLLLPKSTESVVAVWGTLRAGAAYVPIDPTAPALGAAAIAEDCETAAVLVSSELPEAAAAIRAALPAVPLIQVHGTAPLALDGVRRVDLTRQGTAPAPLDRSPVNVRDLAYVLYTSGSTGMPKGVMVSHGAALAFVEWALTTFDVATDDVLSNHAPLHFDLSTFDLFTAAAAGAHVVVLDDETVRFPIRSADVLERYRISVWYSVPGALRRMLTSGRLAERDLSSLRVVLFAGEAYPASDLRRLQSVVGPAVRLANLYGPTETNVCTWWDVPPAGTWCGDQIPIGVDCASCEGVVVDDDLRPVPDGTRGELLIRGGSLMTGYWGDAERTARSFVQDFRYPHLGDRFYRTGDVVSRDASGVYAFHGRRDSMVKVRGYRVELGEIEAALLNTAGVRDAAVVAVQTRGGPRDGDTQLVAFMTPADPASSASENGRRVHAELALRLPKYMLPADYRWLPCLPATSSGKVDRQLLMRLAKGDSSIDTTESSSHRGSHGCD